MIVNVLIKHLDFVSIAFPEQIVLANTKSIV